MERKMKIGIISHYYNSTNYGGNLQAYALTKYVNILGYQTEQISYLLWDRHPKLFSASFWHQGMIRKMKDIMWKALVCLQNFRHWCGTPYKVEERKVRKRNHSILTFNQHKIPHSSEIYYRHDYLQMKNHYDVFITGSDQVWNNQWGGFLPALFLDGIEAPKIKLSYAASLGKSKWTDEEIQKFKASLADYTAISVREEEAVQILSDVAPVPVEWVVDPTLLLTRADWDEICAEKMVYHPYLFCYFLVLYY